jgi:hypothetical protein
MRLEAAAGKGLKVVLLRKGGSTRLWVLPRDADRRGDPTRAWMRELDDEECAAAVRDAVAAHAPPVARRAPRLPPPCPRPTPAAPPPAPRVPWWLRGVRERLDADAADRETLDARVAAARRRRA